MPNIEVTTNGIEKLLKDLKPGKAAGPDGIPTWILKTCATPLAPILQIIFTQSYSTSSLPDDWLTANVTPVYKKGSMNLPSNYRPISLTAVCCKLMEHIIFHSILKHLNSFNIVNPNQHGFRPCQSQLLLVDNLLRAMDSHHQMDLIMLAFSKAVSHKKLLLRLAHYGIQSCTHRWITTWLTSTVVVEGATSSEKEVLSGFPSLVPSCFCST